MACALAATLPAVVASGQCPLTPQPPRQAGRWLLAVLDQPARFTRAVALDVNDRGLVVGFVVRGDGSDQAAAWWRGRFRTLPDAGATDSVATAVNGPWRGGRRAELVTGVAVAPRAGDHTSRVRRERRPGQRHQQPRRRGRPVAGLLVQRHPGVLATWQGGQLPTPDDAGGHRGIWSERLRLHGRRGRGIRVRLASGRPDRPQLPGGLRVRPRLEGEQQGVRGRAGRRGSTYECRWCGGRASRRCSGSPGTWQRPPGRATSTTAASSSAAWT